MPLFRDSESDDEDLDDEFLSEDQVNVWASAEELYDEPEKLADPDQLIIIDDDPPGEVGKSCPVCGQRMSGMSTKVCDFFLSRVHCVT
jgi:hypothetical protein